MIAAGIVGMALVVAGFAVQQLLPRRHLYGIALSVVGAVGLMAYAAAIHNALFVMLNGVFAAIGVGTFLAKSAKSE